jgi:hypothetical protein
MSAEDKPAAAGPVRIARTAKGERPQNFSDPAIDKLLGMTLSLASEVSVLRDRLDAMQRLVERHGLLSPGAIDAFEPTPAERAERDRARAQFMERLLLAVRRELEEQETGRIARPLDDIIADYAARRI